MRSGWRNRDLRCIRAVDDMGRFCRLEKKMGKRLHLPVSSKESDIANDSLIKHYKLKKKSPRIYPSRKGTLPIPQPFHKAKRLGKVRIPPRTPQVHAINQFSPNIIKAEKQARTNNQSEPVAISPLPWIQNPPIIHPPLMFGRSACKKRMGMLKNTRATSPTRSKSSTMKFFFSFALIHWPLRFSV